MDSIEQFRELLLTIIYKIKEKLITNQAGGTIDDLPLQDLKEYICMFFCEVENRIDKGLYEECIEKLNAALNKGLDQAKKKEELLNSLEWCELIIKIIPAENIVDTVELYNSQFETIKNSVELMGFMLEPRWWNMLYGSSSDLEIQELLNVVNKKNKIEMLNFEGQEYYQNLRIDVFHDDYYSLPYVYYVGKKLYFPENWDSSMIELYTKDLLMEQDKKSAHSYYNENCIVNEGDVILDIGAAEGNFSLEHVEKAELIYICEPEEKWKRPLTATFEPYKNKIIFVDKFVGEENTDNCITIDSLVKDKKVNYIKMDIEGAETSALKGATYTLDNNNVRCAVCSYHKSDDEKNIKELFAQKGYTTEISNGYIGPKWDLGFWNAQSFLNGELRRGVVFGYKK